MKKLFLILILFTLFTSHTFAVDTSNWMNVTSDIGIQFQIPPTWAWDPMSQTSLGIRTEKSDAYVIISHIPVNSSNMTTSKSGLEERVRHGMINLRVPQVENMTFANNTVTASGINLDGTIINYTETYENMYINNWIREYSDFDAVTKYSGTIDTIIEKIRFS